MVLVSFPDPCRPLGLPQVGVPQVETPWAVHRKRRLTPLASRAAPKTLRKTLRLSRPAYPPLLHLPRPPIAAVVPEVARPAPAQVASVAALPMQVPALRLRVSQDCCQYRSPAWPSHSASCRPRDGSSRWTARLCHHLPRQPGRNCRQIG